MTITPGTPDDWTDAVEPMLGQVVIRPNLKAYDLVNLIVLRGDHDDRDVRILAHPLAHLNTGDPRKHEVQQNKIRLSGQCRLNGGWAIGRREHLIAVSIQVKCQRIAED